MPLQKLKKERCPRISADDVVSLMRVAPDSIIIVDNRNPVQFNRNSLKGSVNIPFASVTFGEKNIENVGPQSNTLKQSGNKIVIVVGTEETDLELV